MPMRWRTLLAVTALSVQIGASASTISFAPMASTRILPSLGMAWYFNEARKALAVLSFQPDLRASCVAVTASAKVGTDVR
jgi:hypothetical protein